MFQFFWGTTPHHVIIGSRRFEIMQWFHLQWSNAKIYFFLDFRPLKLKVKQTRMSGTNYPVTRSLTPEERSNAGVKALN